MGKPLSLIIQKMNILRETNHEYPVKIDRNKLIYRFEARPSPLSAKYQLELIYNRNKVNPKVYLLGPNIKKIIDIEPPHIYGVNKDQTKIKLCLYYPDKAEWNNSMLLIRTIIPWAIEWLFHYESWLATDEWNGGGIGA